MLDTWGVMAIFMLMNYLVGYAIDTTVEPRKKDSLIAENRRIDVENTHDTQRTMASE